MSTATLTAGRCTGRGHTTPFAPYCTECLIETAAERDRLREDLAEFRADADRDAATLNTQAKVIRRFSDENTMLRAALRDLLRLDLHGPEAFRRCAAARAALAAAEGRTP